MTTTPDYMSLDGQKITALDNNDGTKVLAVSGAQDLWRTTFAKVLASGVDSDFFTQIGALGSGITYSQTGGNLVVNSGATANSELILRSKVSWRNMMTLRWQLLASQRIVNNTFAVELVDVLGDGLAYVINSATSVTVTFPTNQINTGAMPFTAANVGQSVSLGVISGAAGIPGRYAIASVNVPGNSVTFTVASWPATGSGTLSLYGWNFHRSEYTGATATSVNYDAGRRGWSSGVTAATINTTAAPGHMGFMTQEDGTTALLDQLVASSTVVATTQRASRVVNLPEENTNLYLQLRNTNGSVAPASTTAWTIGMASVSNYGSLNVAIQSVRPQPANSVASVSIGNVPAVTINSGTITTVSTVTTAGTPPVPATPYFVNSAATTNGALVITGTSGVQAVYATNIGAAVAYVKLYNKATAPTVGTDIPEMIITVPAAVGTVMGQVEISPGYSGYRFALGLGIAITGLMADTDTTAVAAGQVKVKLTRTV